MALSATVQMHNGAPTLHVNGAPHDGLMFYTGRASKGARQIGEFSLASIHLVTFYTGTGDWWMDDGAYDFARIDAELAVLRAADPDAVALLRVNLLPPRWWCVAHPDELMVHLYPPTGEFSADRDRQASFSSMCWRAAAAAALDAYIRHCEATFPDLALGYHLCAGATDEWSYAWWHALSDFSAPQRAAYCAWLRGQYGDDAALRAAWGDIDASLDTAEVPTDRATPPGAFPLLDPKTDRRLVDYQRFHGAVVAEAALELCRAAKATLAEHGREKLVGIFYGYHFFAPYLPYLANCGHTALARVLAAPEVDFLACPYTYQERHPGGFFLGQGPMASLRLHGKLLYIEDDTRTFLTPPEATYGRCPDRASTIGVLRRNWAGTQAAGATLWWMEQGQGWFSDPALLDDIAAMRCVSTARLNEERRSVAQVAVIISEETPACLRYDDALLDGLVAGQMAQVMRLGAPVDAYLAGDLERVFAGPAGEQYRLVLFLDTLYMPPAQRAAVRKYVARDGRMLLWPYAAGLLTDDGLSPEAMAELTGIRTELRDLALAGHVETWVTGDRLAYGSDRPIGPILAGADPDAETLGWLVGMPKFVGRGWSETLVSAPGLLRKQLSTHTTVWSALPALPDALLRHLARAAGVHIYCDTGEQVLADNRLLAIHGARGGVRTVTLPAPATVRDAMSGAVVCDGEASFTLALERGDTAVFEYRLIQQ
jgi:hypothetical protein